MTITNPKYISYVNILKEELVPVMGCTEPISISYGAARARFELGCLPNRVLIEMSGNIYKNAKSAIIPNTNGLRGVAAAAAAGIIAGNYEQGWGVISCITEQDKINIETFLLGTPIEVKCIDSKHIFDFTLTLFSDCNYVKIRIANHHTNIVLIEKNGLIIYETSIGDDSEDKLTDKSLLNVRDIIDFAEIVCLKDVEEILQRQIQLNSAIADEGITGNYGANIGRVLINTYGDEIKVRARAKAASGSDARMNGCNLPVVIVSGSGNQGITASVPVIEYARQFHISEDRLLRALVVSNLITIHQKTGIGRLSAYCGVVSAGCGSAAGISFLLGGGYEEIAHTIINALAIVSGMVCDGASSSCAAKISSAVEAGLLGLFMSRSGQIFRDGDGLVSSGVESTITNIGMLSSNGMRETDKEILRIMMNPTSCYSHPPLTM